MRDETTIDGTAKEVFGTAKDPASEPVAPAHSRRGWLVGAIATPLALGAAGLSLARSGSEVQRTPVAPTTISALAPSGAVAVKGEVAEIFGNKFVIQDGTGRVLVETGREGEEGKLVAKGETLTAQGRFEKGFLHARLITRGDGNTVVLGPNGAPPAGGLDWAKDKIGLGPQPDVPELTAAAEKAGYSDVRVTGRGPRHLDVAAKSADGKEHLLHFGFDGQIREKPLM